MRVTSSRPPPRCTPSPEPCPGGPQDPISAQKKRVGSLCGMPVVCSKPQIEVGAPRRIPTFHSREAWSSSGTAGAPSGCHKGSNNDPRAQPQSDPTRPHEHTSSPPAGRPESWTWHTSLACRPRPGPSTSRGPPRPPPAPREPPRPPRVPDRVLTAPRGAGTTPSAHTPNPGPRGASPSPHGPAATPLPSNSPGPNSTGPTSTR